MSENKFALANSDSRSGWLRPVIRQRAKIDMFFMKQFRANSLSTWFLRALRQQRHQRYGPEGIYYEFGVGKGRSVLRFLRALKVFCEAYNLDIYSYKMLLFDSFEGMPPKQSARDDHPGFREGMIRFTMEDARRKIGAHIETGRGNLRLVKGFFRDSLTPALAEELSAHPPSIVTVDVDYYSSTKTVLEWLLPFTPTGCLFYFDDMWLFYGHPEMGQVAAINEVNQSGLGYLIPYPELGTTVGGRSYVFARKEFILQTQRW